MGHVARRENITTDTIPKSGKAAVVPAIQMNVGIRMMPVAAGRALPTGTASVDATSNGYDWCRMQAIRSRGFFPGSANRYRPVCTFPFHLK